MALTPILSGASSTDNAIVRFDGTTGKLLQNSVGVLDDSGNLSGVTLSNIDASLSYSSGGNLRRSALSGDVAAAASSGTTTISSTVLNAAGTGTYTPTRSAEANLDANVTMFEAQYLRVRNTVTVSGRFTANPTLAATATSFEMTLPVASNIGAVEDCCGVAFCGAIAGMGAQISGSVANNTMVVSWISSDVTAQSWSFIATYQVI